MTANSIHAASVTFLFHNHSCTANWFIHTIICVELLSEDEHMDGVVIKTKCLQNSCSNSNGWPSAADLGPPNTRVGWHAQECQGLGRGMDVLIQLGQSEHFPKKANIWELNEEKTQPQHLRQTALKRGNRSNFRDWDENSVLMREE